MLNWFSRLLAEVAAGNSSEDGGRRMAQTIYYRTRDGRADYGFSIAELSDGTFRAYISSQPGYGSRSTGAHETHRLTDGGRPYVCWTNRLQSAEDAQRVAALWADATQEYIRTGQRF